MSEPKFKFITIGELLGRCLLNKNDSPPNRYNRKEEPELQPPGTKFIATNEDLISANFNRALAGATLPGEIAERRSAFPRITYIIQEIRSGSSNKKLVIQNNDDVQFFFSGFEWLYLITGENLTVPLAKDLKTQIEIQSVKRISSKEIYYEIDLWTSTGVKLKSEQLYPLKYLTSGMFVYINKTFPGVYLILDINQSTNEILLSNKIADDVSNFDNLLHESSHRIPIETNIIEFAFKSKLSKLSEFVGVVEQEALLGTTLSIISTVDGFEQCSNALKSLNFYPDGVEIELNEDLEKNRTYHLFIPILTTQLDENHFLIEALRKIIRQSEKTYSLQSQFDGLKTIGRADYSTGNEISIKDNSLILNVEGQDTNFARASIINIADNNLGLVALSKPKTVGNGYLLYDFIHKSRYVSISEYYSHLKNTIVNIQKLDNNNQPIAEALCFVTSTEYNYPPGKTKLYISPLSSPEFFNSKFVINDIVSVQIYDGIIINSGFSTKDLFSIHEYGEFINSRPHILGIYPDFSQSFDRYIINVPFTTNFSANTAGFRLNEKQLQYISVMQHTANTGIALISVPTQNDLNRYNLTSKNYIFLASDQLISDGRIIGVGSDITEIIRLETKNDADSLIEIYSKNILLGRDIAISHINNQNIISISSDNISILSPRANVITSKLILQNLPNKNEVEITNGSNSIIFDGNKLDIGNSSDFIRFDKTPDRRQCLLNSDKYVTNINRHEYQSVPLIYTSDDNPSYFASVAGYSFEARLRAAQDQILNITAFGFGISTELDKKNNTYFYSDDGVLVFNITQIPNVDILKLNVNLEIIITPYALIEITPKTNISPPPSPRRFFEFYPNKPIYPPVLYYLFLFSDYSWALDEPTGPLEIDIPVSYYQDLRGTGESYLQIYPAYSSVNLYPTETSLKPIKLNLYLYFNWKDTLNLTQINSNFVDYIIKLVNNLNILIRINIRPTLEE